MLQQTLKREIRHFTVYKQGMLALVIEDRPGQLHSTASPGPAGPPNHPFLNATAFYTVYEHEMGSLLRQANSFDQFVEFLIAAEYDIVSIEPPVPLKLEGGFRIQDTQGLVGVVWNRSGQFTSLLWQPMSGALVFEYATLTVYRNNKSEELLRLLQSTNSFKELYNSLEAQGDQLVPLDNPIQPSPS